MFELTKLERNFLRVVRVATLALFVQYLVPYPVFGQIEPLVVLPRPTDTGQIVYTALGCLDDHNCLAVATAYWWDSLSPYHPYIERTVDGGLTWNRQNLPFHPLTDQIQRFFSKVYYIDSVNILLTGDSGLIYRTTDAGVNWIDQSYPWIAAAGGVSFFDSTNGVIAMGGGVLIRTSDAGAHWQPTQGLPNAYLLAPKMYSPDSFVVYQNGSDRLYSISHAGTEVDSSKWIFNPPQSDTGGLKSITGIAWVGNHGEGIGMGYHWPTSQQPQQILLVTTSDAGTNWKTIFDRPLSLNNSGTLNALENGTGILSWGIGMLLWTEQWRGTNWYVDTIIAPVQYYQIPQMAILDQHHGLALLDDGSLFVPASIGWIARFTLPSKNSVSAQQPLDPKTRLYPNPSAELVTITSNRYSEPVSLMDVLGRQVLRDVLDATGRASVNVSGLPPGMYWVLIGRSGNAEFGGRVMVIPR